MWEQKLELKSRKVNLENTKVLESRQTDRTSVVSRNFRHKMCSRITRSLREKVVFICRRGAGSQEITFVCHRRFLEIVDNFSYLGDLINGEGECSECVIARIRTEWGGRWFREFLPLLLTKDFSLWMKGKLEDACVWTAKLHDGEIWAQEAENRKTREEWSEHSVLDEPCQCDKDDKVLMNWEKIRCKCYYVQERKLHGGVMWCVWMKVAE